MPDIRPNLAGLSEEQRLLALADWYTFLAAEDMRRAIGLRSFDHWSVNWRGLLEEHMQPETLHRISLAYGRYQREQAQKEK